MSQKANLVLNIISQVKNCFPCEMDPCACPFNLNYNIQIIISFIISSSALNHFYCCHLCYWGSGGLVTGFF